MPKSALPKNDSLGDRVCKKVVIPFTQNQYKEIQAAWIRHRKLTGRPTKFGALMREIVLCHVYGKEGPQTSPKTRAERERVA